MIFSLWRPGSNNKLLKVLKQLNLFLLSFHQLLKLILLEILNLIILLFLYFDPSNFILLKTFYSLKQLRPFIRLILTHGQFGYFLELNNIIILALYVFQNLCLLILKLQFPVVFILLNLLLFLISNFDISVHNGLMFRFEQLNQLFLPFESSGLPP